MEKNTQIEWNERTIRYFTEASAYTGYSEKLAKLLLDRIPLRTALCDLGCGAGLVDMELAPFFRSVTCVDISPVAIDALQASLREKGISNAEAICMDAQQLSGSWDTVTALFFGGDIFYPALFSLARERLILAASVERIGAFGPAEKKRTKRRTASDIKSRLDSLGMRYTMEEHSLEYGQPFRSLPDAEVFLDAYTAPMMPDERSAWLNGNLIRTGRDDFPYYLPRMKNFALFVIRKDENEAFSKKPAIL